MKCRKFILLYLAPTTWIVQNPYVCYRGRGEQYGSFQFDRNSTLVALRFRHLSGAIYTEWNKKIYEESYWGVKKQHMTCEDNGYCFSIFVTNQKREQVFPISPPAITAHKPYLYDLPGYSHDDDHIVFKPRWMSMRVSRGERFRVYYGQDFKNLGEDNNSGEHCIIVEASYYE